MMRWDGMVLFKGEVCFVILALTVVKRMIVNIYINMGDCTLHVCERNPGLLFLNSQPGIFCFHMEVVHPFTVDPSRDAS